MQTVDLMLGEWMPDQPTYANPGCIVAKNCLPAPGGYAPLYGPNPRGPGVTGTCLGAELFFRGDNPYIVGGTATSLFTITGGAADSVSVVNSVGASEVWDFAQFGKYLFATSIANDMYFVDDYRTETDFEVMSSPPAKARFVERVGDFLMIGNTAAAPHGIAWSPFNSPLGDWTASRLTQANSAELPMEHGAVTAIIGGRTGMIFQEQGISLLQYVGPPKIWDRLEVSTARGALAPKSVVQVGGIVFFLAQDGFFATNGTEPIPISTGRVCEWFMAEVDHAEIRRTQGAFDWASGCVIWRFFTENGTGLLVYSVGENRWSHGETAAQWIVSSRRSGVTLEGLGALFDSVEEVVPQDMDSGAFRAGNRIMSGFVDVAGETTYATMDGDSLASEWITGAWAPTPGRRVFATEVHPLFDAADWTMSAGLVAADNQRARIEMPFNGPGSAGFCPVRADGRLLHAGLRTLPGAVWSRAQGVQVRVRASGVR